MKNIIQSTLLQILAVSTLVMAGYFWTSCESRGSANTQPTPEAKSTPAPAEVKATGEINSISSPPDSVRPPEQNESTNSGQNAYVGCWSSTSGNFMRISRYALQTRNSYEPLRYKDVTDEVAGTRGRRLLEILDSDESNEFQKYVAFKRLSDNELQARNFASYEDFVNDKPTTLHARWIKTECKTIELFLKKAPK